MTSQSNDLAQLVGVLASRQADVKSFVDDSFPAQANFIRDKSKFKAGFCTRRAGKSYGVGLMLFEAAYNNPGTSSLYVALTRDSAKRIMFKDVFYAIDRKFKTGVKFNHVDLTVTFPNGSVIYAFGMDAGPHEAHKALGQKFIIAVVDEAGSFSQDLRTIVYGVLGPATADLSGQIAVIGTPTNIVKGFFYDIVHSKTEPGWSVHKWNAFENPYMQRQWQEEIDGLKAKNPKVVETPWFKQMYLGEYAIETDKLVYKYDQSRNLGSPPAKKDLIYVLGVDLGYEDDTAFVLGAYNTHEKKLWIVHTFSKPKMIVSEVAKKIQSYIDNFSPYKIVIDNASKQAVEEMKQRYMLPLSAADKTGKRDFIELMNSDFVQGNILLDLSCADLAKEYAELIKDDDGQEHPSCSNHLADAALYMWRYCYTHLSVPITPKRSQEDVMEDWVEAEFTKKKPEFWEAM